MCNKFRTGFKTKSSLPAQNHRNISISTYRFTRINSQYARFFFTITKFRSEPSQANPVQSQLISIKIIYRRNRNSICIINITLNDMTTKTVGIFNKPGFPACNRPTVFPDYGYKKSFAPHITEAAPEPVRLIL